VVILVVNGYYVRIEHNTKMKIQILSDLHREFGALDHSFKQADVLILAGDVDIKTRGIEWLLQHVTDIPVLYILGNHEYYKSSYPKVLNKIKDLAEGSNIHVLENESIEIDNIVFHGTTLWTDFSLFGNPRYYGSLCQKTMNDYKKIRRDPSYSRLRSIDTYNIHKESLRWLEQSLEDSKGKTNIVVTHHAPSIHSVPEQYKEDPISSAYASNLEFFIERFSPKYWIHGHIHEPKRYHLGETEIICNPHGYIDEKYNGYIKELIIDI